jgi:hypothetical protein
MLLELRSGRWCTYLPDINGVVDPQEAQNVVGYELTFTVPSETVDMKSHGHQTLVAPAGGGREAVTGHAEEICVDWTRTLHGAALARQRPTMLGGVWGTSGTLMVVTPCAHGLCAEASSAGNMLVVSHTIHHMLWTALLATRVAGVD